MIFKKAFLLSSLLLGCFLIFRLEAATETAPPKSVQAQVNEALAIKNVTDRLQALSSLATTLSTTDIPKALEIASHLESRRENIVLKFSVLRRWSELSPVDAFRAISQLSESREKIQTLGLSAGLLAKNNIQEALTELKALPEGKSTQSATDAVAAAWGKMDGKKALAWASALPDGRKESALYALRFAWVHADPIGAYSDVATLPPGPTKNALMANIAEEWTTLDSSAAIQWAKTLPDGPEREIALSNTARTYADTAPLQAANFALTLSPESLRHTALAEVVTNWATQQPKDAANWVLAQSDPDDQKNGFQAVMNFWAVIAPEEAANWIEGLNSGPARDTAAEFYAKAVTPWAPDLGAKLIVSLIPNEAGSQPALDCVHQWFELDPTAASKWITASSLPGDIKKQWLTPASSP
jgi:hypothetical protein